MTDSTSPEKSSPASKTPDKEITKETTDTAELMSKKTTTAKKQPSARQRAVTAPSQQKMSKIGLLALIVALFTASCVGGLYYLQLAVDAKQNNDLAAKLAAYNQESQQKLSQQVSSHQTSLQKDLAEATNTLAQLTEHRIAQLEQQISRLEQNQPSDWLLHEAEYLIRVASRSIWLERNTKAAINLLQDADSRLKELDSPEYLPVRQKIRQDIESLNMMPVIASQEVVLTLMALEQQITLLPLSMAKIPEPAQAEPDLTLSDNAADWRENLAKTWHKFTADFITVRRRTGNVEPLMSPSHQQNLRENLSLKLQQSQWAASKENQVLFLATLDHAQNWLAEYFDMDDEKTQKFDEALHQLKAEIVEFDYPNSLSSLESIRAILSQSVIETLPETEKKETPKNEQTDAFEATNNGDII